ncbi:MAG: hypothetical protein FWF30_01035 [Coriobacteriia bacterium]|nr:hypothetical protein [Coriobacteriia bacterium]
MKERLFYIVEGCRGEDAYRASKADVAAMVVAALVFCAVIFAAPWLGY